MTTHAGHVEAAFVVPSAITASVTNSGGGPTVVTVAAGTYVGITAFCAYLTTALNAQRVPGVPGAWSVTVSTGASGTGKVRIQDTNEDNYSITFTSTNLRDLLGHTGNIAAQFDVTGASQARGLWIPDCPLAADGDIKQAPIASDRRTSVGPTGLTYTKRGTSRYRHTGIVWDAVARNRIWIGDETTTNQSYQRWFLDTQEGIGHAWFTPGSAFKLYDHRGYYAGQNSTIASWNALNLPGLDRLAMTQSRYTGLWRVEWPEIVSSA